MFFGVYRLGRRVEKVGFGAKYPLILLKTPFELFFVVESKLYGLRSACFRSLMAIRSLTHCCSGSIA